MTTSTFSQMRNNRQKELDRLTSELEKATSNGRSNDDELYWKPTPDKAGNASAIFRFLPAPPGEDVPFVKLWSHAFQGPGGWYIENSRTTIGEDDPVAELNGQLWNSGVEKNKDVARAQKRKLNFISNIYIIRDPGNPDNEGKVFLYKYGKKIFAMINDLLHPQFEDEKKINAFDFWDGANFKLKMRRVEGYPNYDKSEFDSQTPLFDDDEKLEALWKQLNPLQALVSPDKFKSYDELKNKLSRVLGASQRTPNEREAEKEEAPKQKSTSAPWETESNSTSEDDEDDGLSYFKKIANKED